jgi:hypothetical protein
MPELKKNGATHLALEIDAELQPVLDEFMKTGKLDKSKLPALLQDKDYVDMLEEARKSGLKLVAVDTHASGADRDKHMADSISKVLEADPKSKVVFWVGSQHLKDPPGDAHPSAAELLRKKYDTSTVISRLPLFDDISAVHRVAEGLKDAVAIKTKDAKTLGTLDTFKKSSSLDGETYGEWDTVVVYPSKKK